MQIGTMQQIQTAVPGAHVKPVQIAGRTATATRTAMDTATETAPTVEKTDAAEAAVAGD